MKGKFVVMDGLDGSGKKTQLDLLVKYCKKKKIKTATVDFPQYYKTFFGRLVGRYLKGEFGGLKSTNPYLTSLTFAGDRWQAKAYMDKALAAGKLLLANRYISSNIGFQSAKFTRMADQDKFISWLLKLEHQVYQIPREDYVVYLSVPPHIGYRLVLQKGKRKYVGNKNKHDIHEESLAYLKRVESVYLRLVEKHSHWLKIDCLDMVGNLRSKAEVHQLVVTALKKRKIVV